MHEENLTPLQSRLLKSLGWFHNFCVENGLRYYCLGGTMLGAARHKGFIPWDDDIDVGLPRADYDKLLSLLDGKKIDNYLLETHKQGNKDYVYPFAKLYDTDTTLVENTKYKTKRGIFIDIFPLDGMGNSKEEAVRNYKKIVPYLNLLLTRVCALRKDREWYKNLAIIIAKIVPDFILPNQKILNKIEKLSKKLSFDEAKYISNVDGYWREKEIVEREVFGTPKLYDFNYLKVYGVADYDAYLTHLYNDWRTLPNKEDQVTHHDFLSLDLEKPYI